MLYTTKLSFSLHLTHTKVKNAAHRFSQFCCWWRACFPADFKEELIGCHTSHYLALNAYTLFEWNQAENLCKSLHPTNSFIALPGSEEDMQCLHRLRQTKAVWLGIRYISPDQRTFLYKPRTLDWGSHDLIYKGWRGGLETDREYCSIMARGESRWVSEECNEEHHLICQIRDSKLLRGNFLFLHYLFVLLA